MKRPQLFYSKKFIFFAATLLFLALLYLFLRSFFFESDPLIPALQSLSNSYLLLSEGLSNLFLRFSGSHVSISNHILTLNGAILQGFSPELRFRKIAFVTLLIIWVTKAPLLKKSLFSTALLLIHIICNSFYIAIGAHALSMSCDNQHILAFPNSIALLTIFTVLVFWYLRYKSIILQSLSKYRINLKFLETKDTPLIIIIYLYIIICIFLLEYFDFLPWISFLFGSAQKILALFGHEAIVDTFYLIGSNGTIYMAKYCLGFRTMFLFASLVYLTGKSKRSQWIYIVAGLILLNFVNIIRFVFLFIHVQKNGGYALTVDLHDLYNYITYSIIFILWIIWFEKFSDINRKQKAVNKPT